MGKPPFRLNDSAPRDGQGRFAQRHQPPAPPQIVDAARSQGRGVLEVLAEPQNQASDHSNAGGRAGAAENPWPPAQPATSRPPMRLK